MAHYGLSVHGNSVMAESPGPPSLVDIPGVPQSAVLGYRRGWGNTFRGAANRGNVFHFAVPSPNLEDHGGVTLGEVQGEAGQHHPADREGGRHLAGDLLPGQLRDAREASRAA